MTPETFSLMSEAKLIPANYANQAREARKTREDKMKHLMKQRKLPHDGWSDTEIALLLDDLAMMDSNNFPSNCGVGERESRVYSDLVRRRHFNFGHGIGRSGDLCEVQPKAAGSSTLNKLTNSLVLDLFKQLGLRACEAAFVIPTATGMAITLCLLALRKKRPEGAKYVLWNRIDQKSCFKSILCAGYQPVIMELISDGDELRTDIAGIESKIAELTPDKIACVISTTSCFAPRSADNLVEVAKISKKNGIPHLVNNAYGIQSHKCIYLLQEAGKVSGPYDVFVQSTDKNFMVPVGGAIIAGYNKEWVQEISQTYPGRASASPSIDLFITLMSLGLNGYKSLMSKRKEHFIKLKSEMQKLAEKYGERVLESRGNPISIALTLTTIPDKEGDGKSLTELGSMLFTRGVSGTRVLSGKANKTIEGYTFKSWGSNSDQLTTPYLTAAAAIGMRDSDIEQFIKRLDKVLATKSSFVEQQEQ